MSKLVSICVPTFNQENEIAQTLDGILAQEFDDYEIIIANDASTDGTDEICKRYQEKYPDKIRYILQKENKGIIGNSRDCLLASQGKYIAICEGDDYWVNPLKLSKQVEILDKMPDVSLVHTAWINFNANDGVFTPMPIIDRSYLCEKQKGKKCVEEIMTQQYRSIRFSSVIFRNDLFKFVLEKHSEFFSENFTTIDINIFYTMAYYGRLFHLPEYTTVYRMHDGSVSVNIDEHKSARFSLGILAANAYFCETLNISNDIRDLIFRNCLGGLCPYILKYKDEIMGKKIKGLTKRYGYNLRIGQRMCLIGAQNRLLRPLIKKIILF